MSEKTMISENPWKDIQPPEEAALISGRRIDPDLPWNLFWAVDVDRQCLLVLQHGAGAAPSRRLPKLRGLRVETRTLADGEQILIRLVDREQREIFYRFCMDVVHAIGIAQTEAEAVERLLGRTWRWHRLLRSGRDTRLTAEEQRGLIGELRLIKEHFLPLLGPAAAVRCWTGPLDAPRDFELGLVHLEAKTRGATQDGVVVSSEGQLDPEGCDQLFLYVAQIAPAAKGQQGGITVTEAVRCVCTEIEKQDPLVIEMFEERLFETGFNWEHDYSDQPWLTMKESLFAVKDDFPRITRSMLPPGIEKVGYRLVLTECADHEVDFAVLRAALAGDDDGA